SSLRARLDLDARPTRRSSDLANLCEGVMCDPGETCVDGRCLSGQSDLDGDGFVRAEDCNDLDGSVFPGAPEICNGGDDNCNGAIDRKSTRLNSSHVTTSYAFF